MNNRRRKRKQEKLFSYATSVRVLLFEKQEDKEEGAEDSRLCEEVDSST